MTRGPQRPERGAPWTPGAAADESTHRERQPYEAPRLERLGDIRSLVMGATPGIGDSATNPHIFRP